MNASECQYAGHCHDHGSSLPFTGIDAGIIVIIALIVIVAGFILRWRSR